MKVTNDDGNVIEVVNIGRWISNIRDAYKVYKETGETKGKYWIREYEIKQLNVGLEILIMI